MDTATAPRLPPPDLRDRAVGLAAALRRELAGEVLADAAGRHLYAQDASAYRIVPALAALPRDADDVVAAVTLAAEHGVPVTARGAGTSLAGQTVTWGLVLDTSRHLDRVVALDPDARTAVVQPGVVLDDLKRAAGVHGLTFAPDPSTANRCTLGGMVGNDACGIHSILGGRTSDAVRRLDVVLADGTRLDAGPMDAAARGRATGAGAGGRLATLVRDLTGVRDRHADAIATRLDDGLPRRVSGLHLEALTERHGFHLGRLLTGSEGTLAVTLAAEVDLVDWPPHRALVLAAYPTMADAGDAVPRLRVPVVDGGPIGYEALDATIAATPHVRARLPDAVALLPRLDDPDVTAWAILEVGGATPAEASANATRLAALAGADGTPAVVVTDPVAQARVWTLRKVGLGASTRVAAPAAGGRPGGGGARWRWPGWEDAAVPPARVGDHLRALAALLADHGLDAALYGHLGDGCVHARIGFEYGSAAGRATYRAFTAEAAALCASFGGSLSGEHGDGRARAELLPTLYGHDLVAAFAEVKRAFDPDGQLNPGVLVAPTSRTSHLHAHEDVAPVPLPTLTGRPQAFAYLDDLDDLDDDPDRDGRGSFAVAVQRCVGVGACRRDDDAGVMCPTWRVTHDERHTTRGRARLLAELLRPDTTLERGASGVDDPAVHDALELCLSCKGCAADCPVGVDVSTWKAEVTHQRWAGRRRPLRHHVLGRAADGLRLAGRAPGLVNALGALPLLPDLARRAVGLSTDRPLPRLAPTPLRRRLRAGGVPGPHDASTDAPAGGAAGGTATHHVVLFVDEVVDVLDPEVGVATVEVLAAAGAHVTLAPEVCCGRPLYDRGMLDRARALLLDLLDALAPAVDGGATIVGMEPSCVAVLRDELPAMLPDDPRSARVAGATRTLAEHLVAVGWSPPDLTATHGPGAPASPVLVQRHCHEHALRAGHPDADLLTAAGADVAVLDDGCCGMAGTFGWAAATEPTARAVGEDRLLPRVRAAPAGAVVLADGSSCRTQLAHLQDPAAGGHAGPHGPVPAVHLAQLLAGALRATPPVADGSAHPG